MKTKGRKKPNKVVGPLKQSISHKLVKGSAGPESAANSYTAHLKSHIMQKAEQNKKKTSLIAADLKVVEQNCCLIFIIDPEA